MPFVPPATLIPPTLPSHLLTNIGHHNQHQGYLHPTANDSGQLPVSPSAWHFVPRSVGSIPATCTGHLPVSSMHSMPVVSSPLPTSGGHNVSHTFKGCSDAFAENYSPFPSHFYMVNGPNQPKISDMTHSVNILRR